MSLFTIVLTRDTEGVSSVLFQFAAANVEVGHEKQWRISTLLEFVNICKHVLDPSFCINELV